VLVQPVMPAIADKIFAQLQVGGAASDWKQSAWGGLAQGHQVGAPIPLFPRKDLAPK
jgi:methionyl-tRNA synthetase